MLNLDYFVKRHWVCINLIWMLLCLVYALLHCVRNPYIDWHCLIMFMSKWWTKCKAFRWFVMY